MFAQKIKETHRRVLVTDSGQIFEKKFMATQFGDSYFMLSNEYSVSFSEKELSDFNLNCEKQSSEIKVFNSSDFKKLICIFPKTAMNGIESLDAFLNSNFSSNCKAFAVSKKITFIEVRETFDPLDSKSEKGFN